VLDGGGDVAWGKGPTDGVGGGGNLPPLLPGECVPWLPGVCVPWPLGAVNAPAAAAAGCLYLTADAAAVAEYVAGGPESSAAAWMLTSVGLCHAGVGQWMVESTAAFVVVVAVLVYADAEWMEELTDAVA